MHYFHNLSSAFGGFAPDPHQGPTDPHADGGLSSRDPLICPPLEKIMRAPMLPVNSATRNSYILQIFGDRWTFTM